jgi:hypothetical protein
MFEFLFAPRLSLPSASVPFASSCPSAPCNTLDADGEDAEEQQRLSVWDPLETALAVFALYQYAYEQQTDWLLENYGTWAERLLQKLTSYRIPGSKRRRL